MRIKTNYGWKLMVAALAALVLLLALVEVVGFVAATAGPSRSVIIKVYPGTSMARVADTLEAQGVVTSAWKFRWLARFTGKGSHIQAGEYDLNPAFRPLQILDILASGRVHLHEVTIPEGYSMAQIAATLEHEGLVDAKRFVLVCSQPALAKELGVEGKTLEGYLFPDTYNIAFYMGDEAIARMMVKRFLAVWKRHEEAARSRDMSMKEVVTLASIIEKETGQPGERPLISGVFQNRLKIGMRLQSDPTVIYGLSNYHGNITKRDLLTPTPYNTYTVDGLPPGPIASPGEAAITAAVAPQQCKYLYFVSRNDGSHKFSCSLAEHNQAVAQFQRGAGGGHSHPPEGAPRSQESATPAAARTAKAAHTSPKH